MDKHSVLYCFARPAFALLFLALSVTQFFATTAGLQDAGCSTFGGNTLALLTCWVPVVGAALGIWGSIVAWGWSWLSSLRFFVGAPCALLVLTVFMAAIDGASLAIVSRKST